MGRDLDYSVPHRSLTGAIVQPPAAPLGARHVFSTKTGVARCLGCGLVARTAEEWAALPTMDCPSPWEPVPGAERCEAREEGVTP